jgi:hypothetical protein
MAPISRAPITSAAAASKLPRWHLPVFRGDGSDMSVVQRKVQRL